MPRLEPGLGFPATAAADPARERRHPPSRRKKPPPRRRRPAAAATPVGPRGAPDPDPAPSALRLHGSHASRGTAPRDEEEGRDDAAGSEESGEAVEAAGDSSHSLIECQNQRQIRAEAAALVRPPASHGLGGGGGVGGIELLVLSPRCLVGGNAGGMSKSSTASSRSRSGTFPSPGTPNSHRHCTGSMQYPKGWSSERVPLGAGTNRRYGGSGVVLPFNNGRKLPSKWEDAEKWILSPVSCDGIGRMSAPAPHHRRPKSKSGPLGHPAGVPGAYAAVSPLVPCFDGVLAAANFGAHSPFSAVVPMPEHVRNGDFSSGRGRCGDDGSSRSYSAEKEPYMLRSASIHAWTETLMEASSFAYISEAAQDDKFQGPRGATPVISSPIIKKDAATQMTPEDSISSSPKARHSCSSLPSGHANKEQNSLVPKLEIRDVQVDDQVTVTRWSKRHVTRGSNERSTNIIEWRKKTVETRAPSFDEKERDRCISKCKREEAKITAWENLQKAKAEAAVRKLEMKLEKKRSSSMDSILGKLHSAQKKAQDMRSAVSVSEDQCGVRATKKPSYLRRTGKSFSCCLTFHPC